MGCANPIILPDLCFTLEMATYHVTTHLTAYVALISKVLLPT